MDIKDLMIGDWVYNRVADITFQVYPQFFSQWHKPEQFKAIIQPIPLTSEILEKNGFDVSDPEVKQYHFEEDGQRYHFSLRQMYNPKDGKPNGYSFYAFGVLTIIDYIHQLQNALRLCGIKKEIEL